MHICHWCYRSIEEIKCCARCHKRTYCSRECQIHDWKEGHHCYWCGKVGELNHDFEIQAIPEKGLGLVAKRTFQAGDKIMVERAISYRELIVNPTLRAACEQLCPQGQSLAEKFNFNIVDCGGEQLLFILMSRINNDCLANSGHQYIPEHNLKLLVATKTIASGEEITFSYLFLRHNRHQLLLEKWHFDCQCCGCTIYNKQLEEIATLDEALPHSHHPLVLGKRLLAIYDQLQCISPIQYGRTYYDMYQRTTNNKEKSYFIKQALAYEYAFYGHDSEFGNIIKYRALA